MCRITQHLWFEDWHNVLKFHPHCRVCQGFLPFKGRVIFHCVGRPRCVHSLSWALILESRVMWLGCHGCCCYEFECADIFQRAFSHFCMGTQSWTAGTVPCPSFRKQASMQSCILKPGCPALGGVNMFMRCLGYWMSLDIHLPIGGLSSFFNGH